MAQGEMTSVDIVDEVYNEVPSGLRAEWADTNVLHLNNYVKKSVLIKTYSMMVVGFLRNTGLDDQTIIEVLRSDLDSPDPLRRLKGTLSTAEDVRQDVIDYDGMEALGEASQAVRELEDLSTPSGTTDMDMDERKSVFDSGITTPAFTSTVAPQPMVNPPSMRDAGVGIGELNTELAPIPEIPRAYPPIDGNRLRSDFMSTLVQSLPVNFPKRYQSALEAGNVAGANLLPDLVNNMLNEIVAERNRVRFKGIDRKRRFNMISTMGYNNQGPYVPYVGNIPQ